jgi:DNA-binding MarR family transcriptional regulator
VARRVTYTDEQKDLLRRLLICTTRDDPAALQLELKGLVQTGRGRYGDWVRLTEAGREVANQLHPAASPGPAPTGSLLRGAVPRQRRKAATT